MEINIFGIFGLKDLNKLELFFCFYVQYNQLKFQRMLKMLEIFLRCGKFYFSWIFLYEMYLEFMLYCWCCYVFVEVG